MIMSKVNNNDALISKLKSQIKKKKAELKSVNESNLTNCMFGYDADSTNNRMNIVALMEPELVKILAFLIGKQQDFGKACEVLGIKQEFKWCGYSYEDWEADIIRRVRKINLLAERAQLEADERVLENLLSPEAKTAATLAEISERLKTA